jgi:hypothetical protein
VKGLLCPAGHAGSAGQKVCRVCGLPMWDSIPAVPAPTPIGARRWPLAAVAVAVVMVAAGGVAGAVVIAQHPETAAKTATASSRHGAATASSGHRGTAPTGAVSTTPAGREAMAAIASLIGQGAGVRAAVQQAIDGVEACQPHPAAALTTLSQAITRRQAVVSALARVSTAGVPDGPRLVSTMAKAMDDSIKADQDYQAWVQDVLGGRIACSADPARDANYAAAQLASAQATSDKNAFAAQWNDMASQYGEADVSASDL